MMLDDQPPTSEPTSDPAADPAATPELDGQMGIADVPADAADVQPEHELGPAGTRGFNDGYTEPAAEPADSAAQPDGTAGRPGEQPGEPAY